MGQGMTIWLTGLSGAGKTTLARLVEVELRALGQQVEVLDGDIVRAQLCKDLGFSKEDRDRHIQRIGFVCEVLSRNGIVAIAAVISPYRTARDAVRKRIGRFMEVYCKCPLDVVIRRDTKGLYRKALAGEITNFTGISDPYEEPLAPDIVLETDTDPPERCVAALLEKLKQTGYLAHGIHDGHLGPSAMEGRDCHPQQYRR
ncbi:MAG: adenylyl-sulfate kinase [Nitrospira sp.]|nr:adenylyl-sulfate kinase [Nitrospira sp.]